MHPLIPGCPVMHAGAMTTLTLHIKSYGKWSKVSKALSLLGPSTVPRPSHSCSRQARSAIQACLLTRARHQSISALHQHLLMPSFHLTSFRRTLAQLMGHHFSFRNALCRSCWTACVAASHLQSACQVCRSLHCDTLKRWLLCTLRSWAPAGFLGVAQLLWPGLAPALSDKCQQSSPLNLACPL